MLCAAIGVLLLMSNAARAIDIEGVQNAALDQPRVNSVIKLTPTSTPLIGYVDYFGFEFETINIEAFYDTGASGILLSQNTANAFGMARSAYQGQQVIFSDVGVAGSDNFNVSNNFYFAMAPYGTEADIDNPSTASSVYTQPFGPVRTQIGPLADSWTSSACPR